MEDYGLPETLVLWAEAKRFFVVVTAAPADDLSGLEFCLDAMNRYVDDV